MNQKQNRQYEFAEERRTMVEKQIRSRGITDEKTLWAMEKVPRHLFVPEDCINEAYEDRPVKIGRRQTVSQPYMVAAMTARLKLQATHRVLEIGTGSGYQAAILAEICRQVVTIERIQPLYYKAKKLLEELDYKNIITLFGDGSNGAPMYAPFDRIIVTAGADNPPPILFEQLAEGGLLVLPEGSRVLQRLSIYEKREGKIAREELFGCVFVPLLEGVEEFEN